MWAAAALAFAGCSSGEQQPDTFEHMVLPGTATGGGNPGPLVFSFALRPQDKAFDGTLISIDSLTFQSGGTFGAVTYSTTDGEPIEARLSTTNPTRIAIDPPTNSTFDTLTFSRQGMTGPYLEMDLVYTDPATKETLTRHIRFDWGLAFDLAPKTTPWSSDTTHAYVVYLPLDRLDMTAESVDAAVLTRKAVLYNDTNADGHLEDSEIAADNAAGQASSDDCESDNSCPDATVWLSQTDICPDWSTRSPSAVQHCTEDAQCRPGAFCRYGNCQFLENTVVECQTDYGICRLFEAAVQDGIASDLQCVCPGATYGGGGSFLPDESVFDQPLSLSYCQSLTRTTCENVPDKRACNLDALCNDDSIALCQTLFDHLGSCYRDVARPTDYLMAVCCEGVNLFGPEVFWDYDQCMSTNRCETWNGTCFDLNIDCEEYGGLPASYERLRMLLLGILESNAGPEGPYPNGETTLRTCGIIP